jgi:hypothetical protein
MEQFDGPQRCVDIVGGDVDQDDIRRKGESFAEDGIVGSKGQRRVAENRTSYAGAVDQDLEHSALVTVGGKYGYGQFRHQTLLHCRNET